MVSMVTCFQEARVWMPDPDIVWRAAQLTEDYKGQKSLAIEYEDGEVGRRFSVQ